MMTMMNLAQVKSKKMRKTKNPEEKGNTWVIVIAVIALLMAFFMQIVVFTVSRVVGDSMVPLLKEQNWIVTNNLAYGNSGPVYNDIILFRKEDLDNEIIVKRILGVPTDEIEIKSGKLVINGEPLLDNFTKIDKNHNMNKITVPENCYFVVGDNHYESIDSRHWDNPFVMEDEIIGKVIIKYDYGFDLVH